VAVCAIMVPRIGRAGIHEEFRRHYRDVHNEKPPSYATILVPAAVFAAGVFAMARARWVNNASEVKHDPNWITRRHMGGFRQARPSPNKSSNSTGARSLSAGEPGVPRPARPYEGGAAPASASVYISDQEKPRDWFREVGAGGKGWSSATGASRAVKQQQAGPEVG